MHHEVIIGTNWSAKTHVRIGIAIGIRTNIQFLCQIGYIRDAHYTEHNKKVRKYMIQRIRNKFKRNILFVQEVLSIFIQQVAL
mgnify:CR=1 FL=1